MKKRIVVYFMAISILASFHSAEAQQGKVYRVGLIFLTWEGFFPTQVRGFREALKEFQYIEGQNLFLTQINGQTYDEVRNAAKAYSEQKFDVVVTTGGAETAIARELLNTAPIVFMPMSYPVESGFVKSLARPGTNITGITYFRDVGLDGKRLEMLKEVVPSMQRVILLFDGRSSKENPTSTISLEAIRKVGARLGIKLIEKPVKSAAEAEQVVSFIPGKTTAGVFIICLPLFRDLKKTASIAIEKKFPLIACSQRQVAEGALLNYGPDMSLIGRRGAWYVDRILKGGRPENLPVENPIKFEMVINLRTAKAIDAKIPPEVLQRADKVIR
jgi:putative ABC transport system substrate-binding protein